MHGTLNSTGDREKPSVSTHASSRDDRQRGQFIHKTRVMSQFGAALSQDKEESMSTPLGFGPRFP